MDINIKLKSATEPVQIQLKQAVQPITIKANAVNTVVHTDEILEYVNKAAFPAIGNTGYIYLDLSTSLIYRWGGSVYAEVSPSLALGETSATAYAGDKGKTAYDHASTTHDKTFVGLGNVDNTSDANKPVSSATTTALGNKVDKETGKGLSSNDYTTDDKNKLAGIAAGAEVNVQPDWNATTGDAAILNKPTIDKTAVGLGNVTDNAQVKKSATSTDKYLVQWNGTSGDAIADSILKIDTTSVLPITTNTYNLGGINNYFLSAYLKNIFTNMLSVGAVDTSNLFTIRPSASNYFSKVLGGTTLIDYTNYCNGITTSGLYGIIRANTSYYTQFGYNEKFNTIKFDLNIPSGWNGTTPVLEATYWNGSTWAVIAVTDNTALFTVTGTITFSAPANWAVTTVGGYTGYFLRLRNSAAGISYTAYSGSINVITTTDFQTVKMYPNYGSAEPALQILVNGTIHIPQALVVSQGLSTPYSPVNGTQSLQSNSYVTWYEMLNNRGAAGTYNGSGALFGLMGDDFIMQSYQGGSSVLGVITSDIGNNVKIGAPYSALRIPTNNLSMDYGADRTIGMEREQAAATAGKNLSVSAGSCTGTGAVLTATVTNGGTGYLGFELVQITTGGSNCYVQVTSWNNGVVTGITIRNAGTGYSTGAGQATALASGVGYSTGTGLTVNITSVETSSDKNGGSLILQGGISKGTGTSTVQIKTASAGASGTTDNTPTTKWSVLGNGTILPAADSTYDIGTVDTYIKTIYADRQYFNPTSYIDGSKDGQIGINGIAATNRCIDIYTNKKFGVAINNTNANTTGASTGLVVYNNAAPTANNANAIIGIGGYNNFAASDKWVAGSAFYGLDFTNYATMAEITAASTPAYGAWLKGITTYYAGFFTIKSAVGVMGTGVYSVNAGTGCTVQDFTAAFYAQADNDSGDSTSPYVYGSNPRQYGYYGELPQGAAKNYQFVLAGTGAGSGAWFGCGAANTDSQNYTRIYAPAASALNLGVDKDGTFTDKIKMTDLGVAFNGNDAIAKPSVTGSRTDGTALASLLTALASLGLITDNTTT